MRKILKVTKGKRTYIAAVLFVIQAIILDSGKLASIHNLSEFLAYVSQLSGTPAGVLINMALLGFGLRLAIPGTPVVVPPTEPAPVPVEVKPVAAASVEVTSVAAPAPAAPVTEIKETTAK